MTRRHTAAPPVLPGFRFLQHVGSGGYADVYLYEQQMPSRNVAVKVLDSAAVPGEAGRVMFTAEANLMAKVSAHPYIVQVFQADISPDGRPFLVMEYYPDLNFYVRARQEHMAIDEVVRVGVQVASAVETAHRAGVLHRDIKPANILTSEYRRPGLTDFGIAAAAGPIADVADGVSIPWSAPEALGERGSDRRTDVYALAATIYTLLTGRAPFEISGGDNRPLQMMSRIERDPVPSLGRADVPPSLERLLARAMAKDPNHRPQTAADFARELQAVEAELRLAVTPLELAGDAVFVRTRSDGIDDDSTRGKGITEIHAQGHRPSSSGSGALIDDVPSVVDGAVAPPAARRREGLLAEPEIAHTVGRQRVESDPVTIEPVRPNRVPVVAASVAVALALTIAVALLLTRGGGDSGDSIVTVAPEDINVGVGDPTELAPPNVTGLTGVAQSDGTFLFTWDDMGDGVEYSVKPDDGVTTERVSEPTYTSASECIEVAARSSTGKFSETIQGCAA